MRLDQTREDLLEAVVVADGREVRAVGGKRQGGKSRPLAVEAPGELRSQMLGVGRRAPVAEGEHLAPAPEDLDEQLRGLGDSRPGDREGLELDAGALLEAGAYPGESHRGDVGALVGHLTLASLGKKPSKINGI